MPDPYSIPFKQADGNGHYKSKELPDDSADFLTQLGVPSVFGDVRTGETSTVTGQLTVWFGTDGHTIKAVPTTTSGIVVAQNGVGTFEPHPAGAIVGTDAVQTLTNKTFGAGITFGSGVTFAGGVSGLTKADVGLGNVDNTSDAQKNAAVATLTNKTISLPTINSPTFSGTVTGLTKTSVGLGNVDNTSDLNKPVSSLTQSALDGKENLSRYNTANGYAPLGADSKVPLANLPDAVVGASKYQGTWNATTNIPPIPPAVPTNNGWYYVVATAGNTVIDGITSWAIGDWVISNGSYWQKIPNTNAVTSVNAKTGAVVINKTDVGLSAVDNTSDATKNSAAATLTNKVINGASNTLTVRLDADVTNNLPVSRLNGGTGASAATFWRGDGLWVSPVGAGDVTGAVASVDGEVTVFNGTTGKSLRVFGGAAGFAKVGPGTALSTVPSIGALDVNASIVHGQTQKANATALDEFLVWDSAASALKSMRWEAVAPLPKNYLTGFLMSNSPGDLVNDLSISAGVCRDDTDTVNIACGAMTKQMDALWAAGTNAGARDTGALSATAWYNVFVIYNPTTRTSDYLFSLGNTPTMPSGYVYKRRIFSFWVVGSVIQKFYHDAGDWVTWSQMPSSMSDGIFGLGNTYLAGAAVPSQSTGRAFLCSVHVHGWCTAAGSNASIRCPNLSTDVYTLGFPAANLWNATRITELTNAVGQLYVYFITGTGTMHLNMSNINYYDPRGKDGVYP